MIRKYLAGIKGWILDRQEPYVTYVPQYMQKEIIGTTVLGKDIDMWKIGTGKHTVLMQFGMHGNEVGTVKLGQKILEALDRGIIIIPDSLTILLIPCLHKDGFEKALQYPDYFGGGRVGKRNEHDVEFVKNICLPKDHNDASTVFIAGEEIQVSAGDYPFSEPETQALKKVIEDYEPVLFIDYHNAYPAIGGAQDVLGKQVAEKYRELTGRGDREQLYKTPDVQWYTAQGLSCVFVEGTNRRASDRKTHKHVLPKLFTVIAGLV